MNKTTEENVPQEGDFKIKKKPRKFSNKKVENSKIDLSVDKKDTTIESSVDNVEDNKQTEDTTEVEKSISKPPVQEIDKEKKQEEVNSPIQEITEEEVKSETKEVEKELKEAVRDEKVLGKQLPENIEKLVSFMEETGGNVEDYVRLNADYTKVDDVALLKEFYKTSKPHLNTEEIEFLLNDEFSYNEEEDDEKTIRKRKLAIKEEVAKARNFLEDTKSKYYDEIKLRSNVTQEQKKATDFFNRYKDEQEKSMKTRQEFIDNTNKFFQEDFKGFDFNLGDKKVRYNVNNKEELLSSQSDISNFLGMFLDGDGKVTDYNKYHKSLFAAKNIDTIANHFYEQGKADAVKNVAANSRNINANPRTSQPDDSIYLNGFKVKAVNGANSSKLKIKKR
tara:strand:- start:187 stop:1362 length:1176 start_codon:yes stop_codon:yes gene_type:complete